MTNAVVEIEAPEKLEGKYMGIFVSFVLGLGSLVPWNSLMTIGDYYNNLFPKYHPPRTLTLVYEPFAFVTLSIMAYYEAKVNTRRRNIAGYTLYFGSVLSLVVLDVATSGRGGIGPFIGIAAAAACFGVSDALVQGGMMGDLSFMCPEFIQSYLAGLAAAGALTSALRLPTKAAFEKFDDGLRKGVMLFLSMCAFLEFLCILLYSVFFPKLPIVKYFRKKAASEGSKTVLADLAAAGIQMISSNQDEDGSEGQDRLSTKQLFIQNLDYALGLFLVYMLTLSIFPGFLYENTGQHQLGAWYSLVLIAVYNVWDFLSRYIPLVKYIKLESRRGVMMAVLARFLLIPAFYFAAKDADQGWMIFLTSFLGLTNGYLTVCIFTLAPKDYKGPEQNALGNILTLCLSGGIVVGVSLGWLWLIGKKDSF